MRTCHETLPIVLGYTSNSVSSLFCCRLVVLRCSLLLAGLLVWVCGLATLFHWTSADMWLNSCWKGIGYCVSYLNILALDMLSIFYWGIQGPLCCFCSSFRIVSFYPLYMNNLQLTLCKPKIVFEVVTLYRLLRFCFVTLLHPLGLKLELRVVSDKISSSPLPIQPILTSFKSTLNEFSFLSHEDGKFAFNLKIFARC